MEVGTGSQPMTGYPSPDVNISQGTEGNFAKPNYQSRPQAYHEEFERAPQPQVRCSGRFATRSDLVPQQLRSARRLLMTCFDQLRTVHFEICKAKTFSML